MSFRYFAAALSGAVAIYDGRKFRLRAENL